jgi:hypothetical protein
MYSVASSLNNTTDVPPTAAEGALRVVRTRSRAVARSTSGYRPSLVRTSRLTAGVAVDGEDRYTR